MHIELTMAGSGTLGWLPAASAYSVCGVTLSERSTNLDRNQIGVGVLAILARITNAGWTHSSASIAAGNAAELLGEIKEVSGLTWRQIATALAVTPRSLHSWMSGNEPSATHQEALSRLVSGMRGIQRKTPYETRALLLSPMNDGTLLLDVLAAGHREKVVDLMQPHRSGMPARSHKSYQVDEHERSTRKPLPPEVSMNLLHDPLDEPSGPSRRVRARKASGQGADGAGAY